MTPRGPGTRLAREPGERRGDSTSGTATRRECRIVQRAAAGARGAGLRPAEAAPSGGPG